MFYGGSFSFPGGYSGTTELITTEIYNIKTNNSASGPHLQQRSYSHCAVRRISTDILYIIGGVYESVFNDKVYSYDIQSGGFFELLAGTMSERKARLGCMVLDTEGKILAAQGITLPSWGLQSTSEIYDIAAGEWTSVPHMLPWFPLQTPAPRLIAMLDTLVAIFKDPGSVYIYDKASGQWKETLNAPYQGHNGSTPIAIGMDDFRKCNSTYGP